jgi:hypothetical protein
MAMKLITLTCQLWPPWSRHAFFWPFEKRTAATMERFGFYECQLPIKRLKDSFYYSCNHCGLLGIWREQHYRCHDFPECVVYRDLGSFVAKSTNFTELACIVMLYGQIQARISAHFSKEISQLANLGYKRRDPSISGYTIPSVFETDFLAQGMPTITLSFHVERPVWLFQVAQKKHRKFHKVWAHLPEVCKAHAVILRENAKLKKDNKRLRQLVKEAYRPGGVGAQAAESHFNGLTSHHPPPNTTE